jgi:hypothetical protein
MFRFSIRELALLMVIVALAVAWWIERKQTSEQWSKRVNDANQQLNRFDQRLHIYQDKDQTLRVYRIVR